VTLNVMIKRIAGLAAVATALLLATTPALARGISHKVVPFKSIAGVHFGWSPAHVRRVLGKPVRTARADDQPGEYIYSVDGDENFSIFFEPNSPHDGVSSFSVNDAFHTIKGIHAALEHGSSEAAVRRVFGHYPHFRCKGSSYCTTTRGASDVAAKFGAVEMQFNFEEHKLIGFDMNKNVFR
jgi:hypothetical protein